MAVNTIAPAFRAGCTVVLKPSPFTPVVTLRMGEILRDLVPAGALNVVSGGNELGQQMTAHPVPRGISFTGSIATGKKVNVAAAADLKRVLLELGGNDAAIVLDDADPADVADKLFWPAFRNSGQICMAVKRVFVPEEMEQQVAAALAAKARSVKVGNGLDEGIELGRQAVVKKGTRHVAVATAAAGENRLKHRLSLTNGSARWRGRAARHLMCSSYSETTFAMLPLRSRCRQRAALAGLAGDPAKEMAR
jgi:acyl-CoA reductase-like NAD-dependent aldehyde dehydrogenase